MSYSLVNVYASLPRTTRGAFTHLNADPKGQTLVYVNGNSVFLRNLADPSQCDVYTEHSCAVQVAKYSPSGFYIASADQAGKVRIWDTVNKEHILKNEFQPLSGTIKDLQWSSDSQRIVVGGEGREKFGHVFSADTGTSVGEIMGTSKPINSVDFKSSRPFRCVVASEDNSICYFEGPPFKWKKTLNEHDRFVNVVRYSPNGEKFASGGADGKLIIFDGKTGDKLDEIGSPAHSGGIYSLAWDPSNKFILTVSGDKTAKIWNVETKSLSKEIKFGDSLDDQQVGCLWTPNHTLTVSLSGQINYINPQSDAEHIIKRLKGHNKSITALEVVLDANKFVSASHDGLICHWDAQTGLMDNVADDRGIHAHKNQVQAMRYDQANGLIVTCGYDDMAKFIDAKDFRYVGEIKLDSQPQGIDINKNGTVLIACINKLLVVKNKKVISSTNIAYESTSISVSSGSNAVAVGGRDNKCHIYALDDVNNATLIEILTLPERDFITAVRFSPDGSYLAVADNAKCVKCYKVGTEYVDVTKDLWQHHAGKITAIAWAPDSTHLATSSVDTHVFVYSPTKVNGSIHIKNAHPLNPLTSCVWLDNEHLVTASQDCCIRKWKVNF